MPAKLFPSISAIVIAASLSSSANASAITYEVTGFGSGSYAGQSFTNSLITVTGVGDTTKLPSKTFRNDEGGTDASTIGAQLLPVTISVAGVGSGVIASGGYIFWEQGSNLGPEPTVSVAGFSTLKYFDVLDTFTPTLDDWWLDTPIGPVKGSGYTAVNPLNQTAIPTSFGDFRLQSIGPTYVAAFAGNIPPSQLFVLAASAPEPATWAMTLLGLVGLALACRRRDSASDTVRA